MKKNNPIKDLKKILFKKNKPAITKLFLLLSLVILLTAECATQDIIDHVVIIRYQNVQIPDYEKADYEKLLFSENDEVKYNAICNLIQYARDYAHAFNDGSSDASSLHTPPLSDEEINNAKKSLMQ